MKKYTRKQEKLPLEIKAKLISTSSLNISKFLTDEAAELLYYTISNTEIDV